MNRPGRPPAPALLATAGRLGAGLAAVGALVAVVVRPRRVVVEGASMAPTLIAGDRLLVVRRSSPRVGEIVALHDPRTSGRRLLVKRVTAVVTGGVVVEGDNPGSSTDSRDFGPVARGGLVGRAVYRYGPAGRTGRLR